ADLRTTNLRSVQEKVLGRWRQLPLPDQSGRSSVDPLLPEEQGCLFAALRGARSIMIHGPESCSYKSISGAQHRSETIFGFGACSACRVRASTLQASVRPRRACLPPSG